MVVNLQSREPCDSDQAYVDGGEFNPCGYESEQHDRPSLTVPKHQEALAIAVLAAAKAANVPAAVVLVHGGALAVDTLKEAPSLWSPMLNRLNPQRFFNVTYHYRRFMIGHSLGRMGSQVGSSGQPS